jgi:hypothetical protein
MLRRRMMVHLGVDSKYQPNIVRRENRSGIASGADLSILQERQRVADRGREIQVMGAHDDRQRPIAL